MDFEWDEKKAAFNFRKHGVPFPFATKIFLDDHRVERLDDREDYGENRFVTIGLINGSEIVVVHTLRNTKSASFPLERLMTMKSKHTGTVKFRLDPANPPELTAKEKAALRAAPIDYSDIPSQKGMTWTRPGALVPTENKQQITLRLDADVLKFFKKTGTRYQSRINAALREYVNAHKRAV